MYTGSDRIPTGEIPFFAAFAVYLFLAVLQTSFYRDFLPRENRMNAILLILLLILLIRECCFESIDKASLLLLAAAILFFVTALMSGTLWTACPFLLIYFGRRITPKRLFLFAFCCTAALVALVILSSLAGLIENYQRIEVNRDNNRAYLGFLYALYPGAFLFNVTALIICARGRKIRMATLVLLTAAAYYIYRRTDSRSICLVTLVLIAAALFWKFLPSFARGLRKLFFAVIPLFPVCAVSSIVIAFRFNGSVRWMSRLDNVLTHRLTYMSESVSKYGIRLLGQEVGWVGYGLGSGGLTPVGDYLYVDNMYLNFLQRFGWIAFFTALVLVTVSLYAMYKKGRYELLFVFALITLHGMLDDLSLQLVYNTFWIAAANALLPSPAAGPAEGVKRSLIRHHITSGRQVLQ